MDVGMYAVIAFLLPLIGAVFVVLTGKSPNLRETVTIVTSVLTFGVVCRIVPEVVAGNAVEFTFLEVVPGLPIAFKVEPLGMLYALIASGLWILTSIYAIGYMRGHHETNQTRFYTCFAIAIFAALGIAFSANMFTLFIFYEVLTFSTFPLVTHAGTPEAIKGGRIYLGVLVFTSVTFLLLAVIWTWVVAGTLDFQQGGILAGKADNGVLAILLALYVFGTGKAGVMPFHRWLPNAMVAPTPVSALLHAVAVVKAGVFTVMKVVIYIFGLDLIQETGINSLIMWAAAGTILLSSLIAMRQDNLKARLAYSTVSQLSYIVLGALLATKYSVLGGSMHIAMHAFGKITLFFCAGAIMVASHKTKVSELDGIGYKMPFTMVAFFIGTLSIIGIPPLGGSWSKWYLALGAADAGQTVMVGVFMVSSLLNIAYLIPIPMRAFLFKTKEAHAAEHHDGHDHHH